MGTKAWKAKLILDSEDARAALLHTFSVWNAACAEVCEALLAFRRGEFGEEGRRVWTYLRDAGTQGYYILWCITKAPRPREVKELHRIAADFVARHGFHQGLLAVRERLPSALWKQVIHAARERVASYEEKVAIWNEDHAQWLADRAEWEAEHASYMAVRPLIEQFQSQFGATRGRRARWHAWLTFLGSTPALQSWRGGPPGVVSLTSGERQAARRNPRKAVAREAELFYAKNPELAELNRIHGEYERRFARSWAKRKNPDGFRHRPTFTLPNEKSHPDWPRLQANEGWKALDPAARTIRLQLIAPDGTARLYPFRFVPDPRLSRLTPLAEPLKEGRITYAYSVPGPQGRPTPAQPQGIKVILRGDSAFISISLSLLPPPSAIPVTQAAMTKYPPTWALKQIREKAPELELVTCAVDLGVRHIGAATIAREGEVIARRILHHRFFPPGGDPARPINIPSLAEIAEVKRQLRRARRRSGKPAPGKESCRRLQAHYRGLCEDRYKKVVAAIFEFAAAHGAHIVIFEDLRMLNPDSANERGVNAALMNWNRGSIVRFARATAEDRGLRVATVGAWWTSRICCRCDALGVRFEQGRRREWARAPVASPAPPDRTACTISRLGQWFFCPACRRRVHADINASENLHRVFLGTFPKVERVGREPPAYEVGGQHVDFREIQRAAAAILSAPATPF